MTNSKLKFADDIARFLQMFSGVAAYAEEVGRIGSLEQAAKEAEAQAARARSDVTALADQLLVKRSEYQAQCDAIKAEADSYAGETRAKADQAIEAARGAASRTIADAKSQASLIVAAAEEKKAGMASEIERRQAQLETVMAAISQAEKHLEQLTGDHGAKQIELDRVVAKHDEFLKSIGAK